MRVDDRDEENHSRPFRPQQLAKTENHPAFVLAQHADRLRQEDQGEQENGD
jgi:hypothetical protein